MRIRKIIAALLLALTVSALWSAAVSAEEEELIVQAGDLVVPVYGYPASGVLTMPYDTESGEGTWSFQGTIAGQEASASGSGICVMDEDAQTVTLTMTSIDSWNMPGFAPYVPRAATIELSVIRQAQRLSAQSESEIVYVSYDGRFNDVFGIPVAVTPPLEFPLSGTYSISSPGSGEAPVQTLPNAGIGPGGFGSDFAPFLPVAAGVVALVAVVGLGSRNHRLVAVRGNSSL